MRKIRCQTHISYLKKIADNSIMVNFFYSMLLIIMLAFGSCVGVSSGTIDRTGTEMQKPEFPTYIMGEGQVNAREMALFLVQNNPRLQMSFALQFARLYIEEASFEGVNHDVAFVQMCLETGFLSFGNLVTADQNNFAGLGATGLPGPDGKPDKGLYFPDLRTGVRAHVQHLKAYASTENLNNPLVNPRRRFVRLGSSPTIDGLAGTWAADRQYAVKLKAMLQRLYDLDF